MDKYSISCPVCIDTPNDPRILQCGHTICFKCTTSIYAQGQISCPLCKQLNTCSTANALPKNYALQELLEHLQKEKTSKGGGGAKKQQGPQGKPARPEIEKMIKTVKELVGAKYDDDSIERVLEKNNYDTNNSVDYIFQGNPIPQSSDHNDWQQVTRNSSNKETKAKSTEKRTADGGNEKKDKSETKGDNDKRNDRDDKRNEGRPDRKPKKPEVRFKQEGADGAPEGGYRGPRGDRDSKQNGSPSTHGRPPRRSSGPINASPNAGHNRPPQQSQQHPPSQSPHSQPHASTWGPSAETRAHQASTQQPPATSTQTPQSSSQPQPAPSPSTRPASYSTAASGSVSYSKIVQGNPQPTPPPPQQPQHPQHPSASQVPNHQAQPTLTNSAAASTTAAAPSPASTSTTPVTTAPAKQDYSPSSGSRAHSRASPPPHTAWRPKEPSAASPTLSATPSAPSSAPIPSATLSSSTAPSTAVPASVPAPSSVPLSSLAQPTTQATPQPQTTTQPIQQPQVAPTAQAAPAQTQPAPISPPTSASAQPKRASVVISGGKLHLPSGLQYDENIAFQFGSMGLDTTKPKDLVLNFGTQPTNTPAQSLSQTTQPIQPPAAQSHLPTSTTPPLQQASSQPAHHIPQQSAQPTQLSHSGHTPQPAQQHQAAQHAPAHPTHVQQHVPAHLPQQQQHLNGEQHAGMGQHIVQSPDDIHMPGYPYIPPGYFHMPTFGFSEGNPDDAMRMRSYYEHPNSSGYVASDSSTSTSTVPQNSQSPPPQTPSQYPMQSAYYYPPYGMHPYYQTSAPTQFSQFPGYNMNYNYNRMAGAGGYPPNVHASSSPAGQSHTAYDDPEYKYVQQQGSYSNFYNAGAAGSATGSSQGQQGSGSSVTKPAQSFSPTSTGAEGGKSDYNKYRNEPSFYNNMGQQQGAFNQHQQHNFMQHIPQSMGVPSNQSSPYHHGAQPLSNTSQGQSGGAQRSHYSSLP